MTKLIQKSKKGVTLVEAMFAVVILGILTVGIVSMLTVGGQKIYQISHESIAHNQAVKRLDMVISAISNGSNEYILTESETEVVSLDAVKLLTTLKISDNTTLIADPAVYDETSPDYSKNNFRGWYLELTYNGKTVTGFASNSEGDFD